MVQLNESQTGAGFAHVDAAAPGSRTYWDDINSARWGTYLAQREEAVLLRAHAFAKNPGAAVDLGCGSGQWSKVLSDLGWTLTSVDIDRESLAICKRNVPSAICLLTDSAASSIPGASTSASLVLCIEVPPVIQSPWFLSEAHRVLASQGILIGVWWNRRSWRWLGWWMKSFLTGKLKSQCLYEKAYSAWRRDLRQAGFEVLYEEGFAWAPFGRGSNSPLIPIFAGLERLLRLDRWIAVSPWILFVARKGKARQGD